MRDEAGVGPDPRNARQLVALGSLDDFGIMDGEPDIRGWNVFTATGRELGEVEELLVDPEMGEVVMLDVDLKRDDRHTLAPIKAAWIDRDHRRVVLNTTMFDRDEDIPALHARSEPIESESVRNFNERYARAYGEDGWDRDRDISIRRANDDFRITRSTPPPPPPRDSTGDRLIYRDVSSDDAADQTARTVERTGDRAADAIDRGTDRAADAIDGRAHSMRERRRFVRYGPSRDAVVEEVVVRRRVVDPADLSPSETERLRQEAGDVRTDARDTLVNPPPTEERR